MITNKEEYYKEIQDLSHDIWTESLDQAYDIKDNAYRYIHQTAREVLGGHFWVTRTHYHDQVMRYSMNKDAYVEQYCDETLGDLVRDGGVDGLHREIVYHAMLEDVVNNIYEFMAA